MTEFDLTISVRVRVKAENMRTARQRARPVFDQLQKALPAGCIAIGDANTAFIKKVER